ncbi:MAG: GPR endopeptidase [Ruminococcaceae bacterium]|nr:GPR endopeptidase [Oscillospiraceae bacterium]
MTHIRTDLAIEAHEMLTEAAAEITGVTMAQQELHGIPISRVLIESDEAAQKMGKPRGHYVTLELKDLNIAEGSDYENACFALAEELMALLKLSDKSNVLAVGLGNWNITPDALGPKVVQQLMITRHLHTYIPDQIDEGIRPVCAISPGVLGITGMETGEVIRGVTDTIRPDAVIVVDALAARSTNRISTTIQLCDTGISPGAGVGNKRKALNRETLGVPVIAVGVPTVIDAVTITADLLAAAGEAGSKALGLAPDFDPDEGRATLWQSVPEALQQFIVTPKDVDLLIDRVSKVVANGINLALHKDITFQDIDAYIS